MNLLFKIGLRIKEELLNFLFPHSVEVQEILDLSPTEIESLPKAEPIKDKWTLALFEYRHAKVKRLIWEIKYKNNLALAKKVGPLLADHLQTELDEHGLWGEEVLLIPIPTSDTKRLARGYNHTESLAKEMSNFVSHNHILIKSHETESQKQAGSRAERLHNLENSMQVVGEPSLSDKVIVLVDDVMTTGATFAEARRALREAGAKKVLAIALAH